jgi:hypothetical protein
MANGFLEAVPTRQPLCRHEYPSSQLQLLWDAYSIVGYAGDGRHSIELYHTLPPAHFSPELGLSYYYEYNHTCVLDGCTA